ncbi:MAG: PQQ-dependent sugar dehydrogenase [Pyrinomonadaceae bacterium]
MTPRILAGLLSTIAILSVIGFGQTKLQPQRVTLKNGKTFSLNIPIGYDIIPAAEGLKRVRFFARAPDGRLFVTDMYNLTDNKRGAIYILDGWDERSGKFTKVIPYLTGLHNPNSVQFYSDASGQDWIYIAETGKLTRRKFTRSEEKPSDTNSQTIATFPDYGLSYKYGGWHLTRTIAFSPAGKLYVSVGSSCNSCFEKEKVRATVLEMDPDGKNSRVFARGLRNAVGLKWLDGSLYAMNQGSDHLGTARPDETFYALKADADYGWPYCHSSSGRIFADPKIKRLTACRNVTRPDLFFPARSSAMGFDYFNAEADTALSDSFLVSLHGSTNKDIGRGYKIVSVQKGRPSRDVITGFLQKGKVVGRPCDILKFGSDSFLFTDDHTGVIYIVHRKPPG